MSSPESGETGEMNSDDFRKALNRQATNPGGIGLSIKTISRRTRPWSAVAAATAFKLAVSEVRKFLDHEGQAAASWRVQGFAALEEVDSQYPLAQGHGGVTYTSRILKKLLAAGLLLGFSLLGLITRLLHRHQHRRPNIPLKSSAIGPLMEERRRICAIQPGAINRSNVKNSKWLEL